MSRFKNLSSRNNLIGKKALITGAGRGLGAALALALAEQGGLPVLAGRNLAALDSVAASIKKNFDIEARTLALDLADANSVARIIEHFHAGEYEIDILINNGAMWLETTDGNHSAEDVLAVMNAAFSGTFLLTQGLLPILRRSDGPDIVTIGSISGLPNAAIQTASIPFYAAKRAQAALAEGLAQLLRGTPLRSIAIHPPYLDDVEFGTPAWQEVMMRAKGERATTRDVVEAVLFAITRPRHISLSMTLDADDGGLHSSQ